MCIPWRSKRTRASSRSTSESDPVVTRILCKKVATLEMAPGNRSVQPSPKEIRQIPGQVFSDDSIHGGIQIKSSYFDENESKTNAINRCNVQIFSTKIDNKNMIKSKITKGNRRFEQLIQQKIKYLDKLYDKVYTTRQSANSSDSSLPYSESSSTKSTTISKTSKMNMSKLSIESIEKFKMPIKDKNVLKKLKQLIQSRKSNLLSSSLSLKQNTSRYPSESSKKFHSNDRITKSNRQGSKKRKKEHSTETIKTKTKSLPATKSSIPFRELSKSISLKMRKSLLKLRPSLDKSKHYAKIDSMLVFPGHHKTVNNNNSYDADDESDDDDDDTDSMGNKNLKRKPQL